MALNGLVASVVLIGGAPAGTGRAMACPERVGGVDGQGRRPWTVPLGRVDR